MRKDEHCTVGKGKLTYSLLRDIVYYRKTVMMRRSVLQNINDPPDLKGKIEGHKQSEAIQQRMLLRTELMALPA